MDWTDSAVIDAMPPHLQDAVKRKIIEDYAVEWAIKKYENQHYKVEDTGDRESYDLECKKDGEVRRVEVKGTQANGDSVNLTKNEVKHAKSEEVAVDLFVVSDIELVFEGGKYKAQNGRIRCHKRDWIPDDDDLKPTQFNYRVPKDSQV